MSGGKFYLWRKWTSIIFHSKCKCHSSFWRLLLLHTSFLQKMVILRIFELRSMSKIWFCIRSQSKTYSLYRYLQAGLREAWERRVLPIWTVLLSSRKDKDCLERFFNLSLVLWYGRHWSTVLLALMPFCLWQQGQSQAFCLGLKISAVLSKADQKWTLKELLVALDLTKHKKLGAGCLAVLDCLMLKQAFLLAFKYS